MQLSGKAAQTIAACILLAACGGPSVSPPLIRTETTVPYGGLPQTIPFVQNAYSGALTLPTAPSIPPSDTITLVSSQAPFSNVPALQSAQRRAASATSNAQLIYFELTASGTTTFASQPTFTVQLPPHIHPSDGPFYVAFFDPTASSPGWNLTFEGPGTLSGSTLSFTAAPGSLTLQAGLHYYYAVYQIVTLGAGASPSPSASSSASPSPGASTAPTTSPTPSTTSSPVATAAPTPTPTPTPLPSGSFGLSSSSLSIIGAGSANAQHTTLQSPGYAGAYTESDNCSSIATIAMSSTIGPSSTVTVTGLAQGSCTASFGDAFGRHASLSITVTVSGFFISSHERATRHAEFSRA